MSLMSHVWEVSAPSSQAAADPGCHKPPPGLGELWRNVKKQSNPTLDWTLVCEIPVSQINNTFVLLSSFSFNNDEDAEDCIKCGPLDTLLKSSHKVHYNLHQQLDTIIKCFMFNFVQFIHDTIHD